MIRSKTTFYRIVLPIVAVLLVVVTASFYVFIHQPQIPVTGIDEPAPAPVGVHQTIELGAGYTLVLDGLQGKIIAPETIIKPGPKTIDLGAGYTLVLDGLSGKIVAPARPSTTVKRTELGAGYVLEETAYGGRIIAPSTFPKAQPLAPAVHRMDLGGGYWLETGPDGGQIVKEGSR